MVVEFDPAYRDDKKSCIIEKTTVLIIEAMAKRTINLTGEIIYPNLKLRPVRLISGPF